MPSRTFVRHDDTLSGRWCLEGTAIAIAAIRADYSLGRRECLELHAASGLTEEELDAILEFEFPAIRDVAVRVQHFSLTVHCECGEDIHFASTWPEGHVECICGRQWDVEVTARLKGRVGSTMTSVAAR